MNLSDTSNNANLGRGHIDIGSSVNDIKYYSINNNDVGVPTQIKGLDVLENVEPIKINNNLNQLPTMKLTPLINSSNNTKVVNNPGNTKTTATTTITNVPKKKEKPKFEKIKEEDFESIGTHVRGRCKYEDVNIVYEKIWNHYQDKANIGVPLSKQELLNMGCNIIAKGLTGQQCLVTLKALKLIDINSKQQVELLVNKNQS
eukprot:gene676-836_t